MPKSNVIKRTNKRYNRSRNSRNSNLNGKIGNIKKNNNMVVPRRRRPAPFQDRFSQSIRVKRKEILGTGTFTTDTNLNIKHFIFDAANGPAWFKKMCDLYEKYKMHSVDLEVVFGGSRMTKGVYILSYNTNYDQRNDTSATESAIAAQKGAIQVPASSQIGRIHINGSGLTGYSTTLPTTGNNSYCFDAIIAGTPPEDVPFTINVIYDATFYNPQISD